jgi:hypothetical protein
MALARKCLDCALVCCRRSCSCRRQTARVIRMLYYAWPARSDSEALAPVIALFTWAHVGHAAAASEAVTPSASATSAPTAPLRGGSDSPPHRDRSVRFIGFASSSAGSGCPFLNTITGTGQQNDVGQTVRAVDSANAGKQAMEGSTRARSVDSDSDDGVQLSPITTQRCRHSSLGAGPAVPGALVAVNGALAHKPTARRSSSTQPASPGRLLNGVRAQVSSVTVAAVSLNTGQSVFRSVITFACLSAAFTSWCCARALLAMAMGLRLRDLVRSLRPPRRARPLSKRCVFDGSPGLELQIVP